MSKYGLNVEGVFSLPMRLLMSIVEKLVAMPYQLEADGVLRFELRQKVFKVLVLLKRGEENGYYVVKISDGSGEVLLTEEVFVAGFPSTINHHPFCELIKLSQGEKMEPQTQRTLDLLARLS